MIFWLFLWLSCFVVWLIVKSICVLPISSKNIFLEKLLDLKNWYSYNLICAEDAIKKDNSVLPWMLNRNDPPHSVPAPKSSLPWSLLPLFVSDIWVPPQSTKCHTQFQISRPQDSGPVSMSAAQGQSEASPPPRLLVIPATFLASSAAALAATAIKMFVNPEVEFSGMKMCVHKAENLLRRFPGNFP